MSTVQVTAITSDQAREQIATFVACLYEPDDVVEVRMIHKTRKNTKGGPLTESTWHRAQSLPTEAIRLVALNEDGWNIYLGANARKDFHLRSDTNVAQARSLFADFDHMTVEAALEMVRRRGLPDPTLTVSSGHGCHVYWLLSEMMADLRAWSSIMKDLERCLGSDSMGNPERIMRLPGFLNVKKDPAVPCEIIDADPQRRYDLADLLAVIPETEQAVAVPAERPIDRTAVSAPGLDVLARATTWLSKRDPCIQGQRGDNLAYTTACNLVNDFGLSVDQALPLMQEYGRNCSPPWSETELRTKLANAVKYGKHPVGMKAATVAPRYAPSNGTGSANTSCRNKTDGVGDQQQPSRLIQLATISDIINAPPPRYRLAPVVPDGALVVPYGPSGSGKSFVVLDWGLCIASKRQWLGRYPCEQGVVVYVAAEGRAGLGRRIQAWMEHNSATPDELVDWYCVPQAVNFMVPDEVDLLCSSIDAATGGQLPAVVILDTLARSLIGGNENAAEDMGAFVANVGRLQERYGCTAMVVHHTGWDESRTRGSSSLKAAVDLELRIQQSEQLITVTCTKSKDAEEFAPIYLRRSIVQLRHGGSSCVLSPADSPRETLSDLEQAMLNWLAGQAEGATRALYQSEFVPDITSKASFDRAIRALYQQRLIVKTGKKPHVTYKVARR